MTEERTPDPMNTLRPFKAGSRRWDYALLIFAQSHAHARHLLTSFDPTVEYRDARVRSLRETEFILSLRRENVPHVVDDVPACERCNEWHADGLVDDRYCRECVHAVEAQEAN